MLDHVWQPKEQNEHLAGHLKDDEKEMKKVLGMVARGALKKKRRQVDNGGGGAWRPPVKRARRENNVQDLGESAPR